MNKKKRRWKTGVLLTMLALIMSLAMPGLINGPGNVTRVSAAAVKLSASKATLIKGESKTLKVSGTTAKATWSTSNKNVATVSASGKIVANKKGTATITAKVKTYKLNCRITVEEPAISKTKISVYKGNSYTLKITGTKQKITWSTSKKSVATVSTAGKITAKANGSATIIAAVGTKKYSCKVTVLSAVPVKGIKLNKSSATVMLGKTTTLSAAVTPSNATNKKVTWSTSSSKIATVNSAGKVTARGKGTCTITAKVGNYTATCKINVTNPPMGVDFYTNQAYTPVVLVTVDNKGTKPMKVLKYFLLDTYGARYELYMADDNVNFINSTTINPKRTKMFPICRKNYSNFSVASSSLFGFIFYYDSIEYIAVANYYGNLLNISLSPDTRSVGAMGINNGLARSKASNLSENPNSAKSVSEEEKLFFDGLLKTFNTK